MYVLIGRTTHVSVDLAMHQPLVKFVQQSLFISPGDGKLVRLWSYRAECGLITPHYLRE
jgi:hypothetical protein